MTMFIESVHCYFPLSMGEYCGPAAKAKLLIYFPLVVMVGRGGGMVRPTNLYTSTISYFPLVVMVVRGGGHGQSPACHCPRTNQVLAAA